MNYLTGKGFIGKHLLKKVEAEHIPHELIQSIKLKPFDNFYFLSSYGNLITQTDEDLIFKANIEDLLSILKQIKRISFKSFIYLSTSSTKLKNQTTYSRSKRAAEQILRSLIEKYNYPILIIQPFSVTGIGEQREHLIPTLIDSCYTGKLVNFVPNPVHDYIDVDDLVSGITILSNLGLKGIFELGSGVSTSNKEVLAIVEEITKKKANINEVSSLREYDNQEWVSTNFKARGYRWIPRKTLRDSIKEMVREYEKSKK